MKIPESIKVGGHDIKVDFADTAHSPAMGQYNSYANVILLEREGDTPEDNVSECLLHEILEVIKQKNNLAVDHAVLTVISECLFQVFRDNDLDFGKQ